MQFHSRGHFSAQLPQCLNVTPLAFQKTTRHHYASNAGYHTPVRLVFQLLPWFPPEPPLTQPLQPALVTLKRPPLTANHGPQATAGWLFLHSTVLHWKPKKPFLKKKTALHCTLLSPQGEEEAINNTWQMSVHCLMHLWTLLRFYGYECGREQSKNIPLLFILDFKNMDKNLFKTVVEDNYHWKRESSL